MSSDKSHKDPFECDEEVEDESASSINSDEQEHKEFIESSENVPMDDDDDDVVESLLFSFIIIPLTFISTMICIKKK